MKVTKERRRVIQYNFILVPIHVSTFTMNPVSLSHYITVMIQNTNFYSTPFDHELIKFDLEFCTHRYISSIFNFLNAG